MADFFEVDFLDIESKSSGDAITLRYSTNDEVFIHVVDGGYQDTGPKVVEHVSKYYDGATVVDRVVVTHPDGDHAGGLRHVLEELHVRELWMLRPWLYAHEIIDRFDRFTSVANLIARLKEVYPNIAALEEIATERGIPIMEPFQGSNIGHFNVLAPSRERYLDLVVQSERTPEASTERTFGGQGGLAATMQQAVVSAISLIRSAWGEETFSTEETSAENEMSVVQHATLCENTVLLTGDVGRGGLAEGADYAELVGITIPGVDRFQVPHHGSRRNVSTEVLDRWLGPRLSQKPESGEETFTAIISASKEDSDHPRKAVVRAVIHRGAKVVTTEGRNLRTGHNAPEREGWSAVEGLSYPEDQEE